MKENGKCLEDLMNNTGPSLLPDDFQKVIQQGTGKVAELLMQSFIDSQTKIALRQSSVALEYRVE